MAAVAVHSPHQHDVEMTDDMHHVPRNQQEPVVHPRYQSILAPNPYHTPPSTSTPQSERDSIHSTFHRTPAVPHPEELSVMALWELLLKHFDEESPGDRPESSGATSVLFQNSRRHYEYAPSGSRERKHSYSSSVSSAAFSSGVTPATSMAPSMNPSAYSQPVPTLPGTRSASTHYPNVSSAPPMQQISLRAAFWDVCIKDDHPDTIVRRFLHGSKCDVDRAIERSLSSIRWRIESADLPRLMSTGEEGFAKLAQSEAITESDRRTAQGFMSQFEKGLIYFRGHDRGDKPICWSTWLDHRRGAQPTKSMLDYILYQIETARLVMNPGLRGACQVFDMRNVLFINIDLYLLRWYIEIMRENYPLALGQIIIHCAPRFFDSLFAMVRQMINAESMQRIKFTRSIQDLEQYIDRKWIPKSMGGDDQFQYFYPAPAPGENECMKDFTTRDELLRQRAVLATEFEGLTRAMINSARNGSADLETIKIQRECVSDQLRESFWRLDPYVRARSFYDRWSVTLPPISQKHSSTASDIDICDKFRTLSIDMGTQTDDWLLQGLLDTRGSPLMPAASR